MPPLRSCLPTLLPEEPTVLQDINQGADQARHYDNIRTQKEWFALLRATHAQQTITSETDTAPTWTPYTST